MAKSTLREHYKRFLSRRIYQPGRQVSNRSALIFAPHQDDETLGCGGMIYHKTQAGAPVWVAYMTDGSGSHLRFKERPEMRATRRQEALSACQILGVPAAQVLFLGFPNGALKNYRSDACMAAVQVIQTHSPDEIYLPCEFDFHEEHYFTWAAVMDALQTLKARRALEKPVQVYEYPIWYFHHWPWTELPPNTNPDRKAMLIRLLSTAFGLRSIGMFQYRISVADCLPVKRAALSAHASQTTQLISDPHWLTLADVWNGEFTERFFQPCEVFRIGPYLKP